ncbi:hypothetical protein DID88_001796 [Monilinia fructigena]|uniref:Uncharacterized protein n=1 Tax=Monilinia fructigena TaxID=38457 RepID=A0A395IWT5_9HELO|nr:hypothetical protein DID88_001796 [Monilinia fructigena]
MAQQARAKKANNEDAHWTPTVSQPRIHLFGKEHRCGTPERSQKSFSRQCRRRLMLIRINKVVIRRVIEEDEAESDGEAANGRPDPMEMRVGGPGKDEETDGDEPTGGHHGY